MKWRKEAKGQDTELHALLSEKKHIKMMPAGPPSMNDMTPSVIKGMGLYHEREREIVMMHYLDEIRVEVQNWLNGVGAKPDPYAAPESSKTGATRHP